MVAMAQIFDSKLNISFQRAQNVTQKGKRRFLVSYDSL